MGALLGIAVASGVICHWLFKRWVSASVIAALTSAFLTIVLLFRPRTFQEWTLFFGITAANALIIALGVGIPFKRRRSANQSRPSAEALVGPTSRLQVLGWLLIGIAMTYIFLRAP